ncbi:MAG TPA: DUF2500 domain-containing protein [Symbiobacteriaceae bacterium]|jgi:hypothetical protein|nr:DUF2500 domain-containing protein [Symbiobacteriaceae bacterium]
MPFGHDPFGGPPPIIFLPFLLVGGVILYLIARIIVHNANNASAPRLSRQARVVAKRQHVWGHNNARTTYYATFEFPDGAREELEVPAEQFGYLVEGDEGTVDSQGTWFKGFDRRPRQG